jgi:uncharacterized membrane protein YgcG
VSDIKITIGLDASDLEREALKVQSALKSAIDGVDVSKLRSDLTLLQREQINVARQVQKEAIAAIQKESDARKNSLNEAERLRKDNHKQALSDLKQESFLRTEAIRSRIAQDRQAMRSAINATREDQRALNQIKNEMTAKDLKANRDTVKALQDQINERKRAAQERFADQKALSDSSIQIIRTEERARRNSLEQESRASERLHRSRMDQLPKETQARIASVQRVTDSAISGINKEAAARQAIVNLREEEIKKVRTLNDLVRDAQARNSRGAIGPTTLGASGGTTDRSGSLLGGGISGLLSPLVATNSSSLGRALSSISPVVSNLIGLFGRLGGTAAGVFGIAQAIKQIVPAAMEVSQEVDIVRNRFFGLTGSISAANARIQELRQVVRSSPGVTTTFALDIASQFGAVEGLTTDTINNIVKSIGRLNSVFTIKDVSTFGRNLTQLFSTGFSRIDVKEALRQVPTFERILEEAFGTSDPEILRKMKESGELTMETWFNGLNSAINRMYPNAKESFKTTIEKLTEEISLYLQPFGDLFNRAFVAALETIRDIVSLIPKLPTVTLQENLDRRFPLNRGPITQQELADAAGLSNKLKEIQKIRLEIQKSVPKGASITDEMQGIVVPYAIPPQKMSPRTARLSDLLSVEEDILRVRNEIRQFGEGGPNVDRRGELAQLEARLKNLKSEFPGIKDIYKPLSDSKSVDNEASKAQVAAAKKAADELEAIRRESMRNEKDALRFEIEMLDQKDKAYQKYNQSRISGSADIQSAIMKELSFEENAFSVRSRSISQLIEINAQEISRLEKESRTSGALERLKIEQEIRDIKREQLRLFEESESATNRIIKARLALESRIIKARLVLVKFQKQDTNRIRAVLGADIAGPANLSRLDTPPRPETFQAISQASALRIQQIQIAEQIRVIEEQVERGAIARVDAEKQILAFKRQEAQVRTQILQLELQSALPPERRAEIEAEIQALKNVGIELTNAERFMKGFRSAIESTGDAFEKLGVNISNSFASINGLLGNLKKSFLQFFKDLLGSGIQRIFEQIFAPLSDIISGGNSRGAAGSGRSAGGVINNIVGGILGGGSSSGGGLSGLLSGRSGSAGGLLTPNFNPNVLLGANIGGPNLNVPLSIPPPPPGVLGGASGATSAAVLAANIKGLFKGVGFGLKPGTALGGFASIAPLLGVGIGASLGGQSRIGQAIGGIGGGLLGVGITAAPAFLAKSALAGTLLGKGLIGLFSNPITAGVGAALLVGSILLSRSQQRRSDEQLSGDYLQSAVDQIIALKERARIGQLDISEARNIFEQQILRTFTTQIQGLKSKSVRESRLTNQVRDLRNLFESQVVPAVTSSQRRSIAESRLIPEFATGGVVPGIDRGYDSVLARLRPGEMVLNRQQQSAVRSALGYNVFAQAGVPNAAAGGFSVSSSSSEPMVIELNVNLGVSREQATSIVSAAASTTTGRRVIISQSRRGQGKK